MERFCQFPEGDELVISMISFLPQENKVIRNMGRMALQADEMEDLDMVITIE
jgi:hypothetical protein